LILSDYRPGVELIGVGLPVARDLFI